MNRRNKPITKKLDFEPKVPTEKEVLPVIKEEQIIDRKQQEPSMKGAFAPITFSATKEMNTNASEFILTLPGFFSGDCSLVIFTDKSFGIRMNDTIYECDSSFQGDSMVVEIEGKVKKVGVPDFIMNAFPYKKAD